MWWLVLFLLGIALVCLVIGAFAEGRSYEREINEAYIEHRANEAYIDDVISRDNFPEIYGSRNYDPSGGGPSRKEN